MASDKKLEKYLKFIPPAYKPGVNPFVTALLKALAESDYQVEVQIEEAGKQIFVQTAEGKYLDSLGANVGVDRPLSINLSDDKFRKLIPTLSYKPKQIKKTMYDILDVFWGELYSRANLTSKAPASYNLGSLGVLTGTVTFQNGSLAVSGVGTLFTTEVTVGDYVRFNNHTNQYFARVSRIIDDTSLLISEAYKGGGTNSLVTGVGRVYVPLTLVLDVDNGEEKTLVLPPNTILDTTNVSAEEVVSAINAANATNSTTQTITASVIDDFVRDLQFVNIRTNTPGPTGSLRIVGGTANKFAFGVQNFINNNAYVSNAEGALFSPGEQVVVGSDLGSIETSIVSITPNVPVNGVTQITVANNVGLYSINEDCFIYKKGHLGFSDREIIITQLKQQTIIYEINPKELIVRIPATVPALRRSLKGSMHLRDSWSGEITAINNGLKTVTVNLDSQDGLQADYHNGRIFSVQFDSFTVVSHTAGKTGVTIQFGPTDDLSVLSTTPGKNGFVILDEKYLGPYMYDPANSQFTATSKRCVLNQVLSKGSVFPSINVIGADDIPNEVGFLIFDFGKKQQEQPIKYRGRPNNNTLLLDPSYVFQKTHIIGEVVNVLIPSLKGTTPRVTGDDYATFVTGVKEARLIVQELLRQTKAAGVSLKFIIDVPKYLWTSGRPADD